MIHCNGPRGEMLAEAVEEVGAIATRAPNQVVAADRLAEIPSRHVILSPSDGVTLVGRLAPPLPTLGCKAVLLAEPPHHAELRGALPAARIADRTMSSRSLLLFLIEAPDE